VTCIYICVCGRKMAGNALYLFQGYTSQGVHTHTRAHTSQATAAVGAAWMCDYAACAGSSSSSTLPAPTSAAVTPIRLCLRASRGLRSRPPRCHLAQGRPVVCAQIRRPAHAHARHACHTRSARRRKVQARARARRVCPSGSGYRARVSFPETSTLRSSSS
jgi:hypothetical protein